MGNTRFPALSAPLRVGPLLLKNRMISAPTSLAELSPEGFLEREQIAYYEMRAMGGCAMVIIGDAIVKLSSGKSHPKQIPMDDEAVVPSLTAAVDAIHSHGALASIELDHGGELSDPSFLKPGVFPMGPTGGIDEYGDEIRQMTLEDMEEIAEAFAQAADRAKRCGFDMVMIHGGHGWLLHQFLSPLSNHRTDRYGGSLENRMRFPLMVIERVRQAVGPLFPIDFRMSATEFVSGGYDITEGVEIAKRLDGKVDLIHVSAGTQKVTYSAVLMHPPVFSPDGSFVEYARVIKAAVSTPVAVVGALSNPEQMEDVIASGAADLVAMGRALLADPFLPAKIMRGQAKRVRPCLKCLECEGSMHDTRTIRCAVNPIIGQEIHAFRIRQAAVPRKLLIAGGGPGGMEAAITAARLGHTVTLCEASDRLGGSLNRADLAPWKNKLRQFAAYLADEVARQPVSVRINTPVTPELVRAETPDVLILAIGGVPLVPAIPGADEDHVIPAADPERVERCPGKTAVVVGGGLIGCETALHLAQLGHVVSIVELRDAVAPDCNFMHRIALFHELEQHKVQIYTNARCTAIRTDGVDYTDADGTLKTVLSDAVLLAAGMKSLPIEELVGLIPETYVIGDCGKVGKILPAVRAGYDIAMHLSIPEEF